MRRWQSGQMQEAVNLPEYSYAGSNPARRTNTKTSKHAFEVLLYFAAEQDSKTLPAIFRKS